MLLCKSVTSQFLTPDLAENPPEENASHHLAKPKPQHLSKRPERGGPVALWKLQTLQNQLQIENFRDFGNSEIATKIGEHHPPVTRVSRVLEANGTLEYRFERGDSK